MRRPRGKTTGIVTFAIMPSLLVTVLLVACDPGNSAGGNVAAPPTPFAERASRRAFDGAPPVIPHMAFGSNCESCHDHDGMEVPNIGYAPPQPHEQELVGGKWSRCRQCHVFQESKEVFKASEFEGLAQVFRGGSRQSTHAPPVMPHATLGRENCIACHSGPAGREEIRCSHPERPNCRQCHVPRLTTTMFER